MTTSGSFRRVEPSGVYSLYAKFPSAPVKKPSTKDPGVGRLEAKCGFRRSRPPIPIGSRPPIPIRSRPPFRFEAGHPAFASADRGDDVSARRLGQADMDFGPAETEKGWPGCEGRIGWRWVTAGVARPPQRRSGAGFIHRLAAPRVGLSGPR